LERGFEKEKVVCMFYSTLLDTWSTGRSIYILPRRRDGRCRQKNFNKIITGDKTWYFSYWPRNKATEFWMGWWDIPSAEETEIPKVPHQEHVDNFFRLSRPSAQRIRTRGKNSACKKVRVFLMCLRLKKTVLKLSDRTLNVTYNASIFERNYPSSSISKYNF
jgi:hypothetical protein